MSGWAIAIHGGAGAWLLRHGEDELDQARAGLRRALEVGSTLLAAGAEAVDAAVAAVQVLEDEPCFNAGIGAALNAEGEAELDAGLMRGADGAYGAVAAVRRLRSPIVAARAVLDHSRHALLVGPGAERFALDAGCDVADPALFVTEQARAALARSRERLDPSASRGTVGAVVRDARGRLAAATSTGGITAKHPGRVGDSPLPGSGTWADDRVAISATGDGEAFMRTAFAHAVARDLLAGDALDACLAERLADVAALDAMGGAIAVPANGEPRWAMVAADMARGLAGDGLTTRVAIGADEG